MTVISTHVLDLAAGRPAEGVGVALLGPGVLRLLFGPAFGLPRGDLDRIVRQQYFIGAVFRKVTSVGTLLRVSQG